MIARLAAGLGAAVLVAAGAAGAAAPPARTLVTAAHVTLLAADGDRAAFVVPGDGRSRCTRILVWRPGAPPATVTTQVGCGRGGPLEAVTELALAGRRVVWQETNGGNDLELLIKTATLATTTPRLVSFVVNGNGAGGDPGGDYTGHLLARGSVLVFGRWSHCEPGEGGSTLRPCRPGQPDLYGGALHRIVNGRDTVLRRGDDVLDPVWVDGGRTLVRRDATTLLLLRTTGGTLQTFHVPADTTDAVFQGARLAALRPTALDVYDTAIGRLVHSFPLARRPRRLVDLQGGIAVLLSGGQIHLVKVDSGRGATVVPAAGGTLLAQLEPAGLFYASGTRVTFLPLPSLLGRFR